jgi:hypothetical protein
MADDKLPPIGGSDEAPTLLDGAPDWAAGADEDLQRQIIAGGFKTPADLVKAYASARSEMDRQRSEKEQLEQEYLSALNADYSGEEDYVEQAPDPQSMDSFEGFDWAEFVNRVADRDTGDVRLEDIAAASDWRSTQRDLALYQQQQNDVASLRQEIENLRAMLDPVTSEYSETTQERVFAEMRSLYGEQFEQLRSTVEQNIARARAENPSWMPRTADFRSEFRFAAGELYEEQLRRQSMSSAARSLDQGSRSQSTRGASDGLTEAQQRILDMERLLQPGGL